ncbi:MAG: helix-turn-helix transcriptional regulator [Rikenellaceae bacterium]|nr:helix-turn-helix transcriptional regulator [Rikenellaceae bacterium]
MTAAERLSYLLQGASLMFFLFSSISLFQSEQCSRLKRALALVVLFFAISEFKDILRIFPVVTESAYAMRLLYSIDLWVMGVCATYFIEFVRPGWFTFKRAAQLSSVFILFTGIYAITGSSAVLTAELIYVGVYCFAVLSVFGFLVVRYNHFIRNNYSNLERLNLNWLISVLVVFLVCIVVWTIYLFNHNYYMKSVYYIISLIAWIMLIARSKKQIEVTFDTATTRKCHFATTQGECSQLVEESAPIEESAVEEEIDSNTSQLTEQMKAQLNELMTVREIYLDSRLTLSDLAAELGTNRTYLSNYLNRELNVSFYDYVNSFRVKRACRMIDSDPDVSVHDIVESCGFNSVSTFRRSFTREIGRTYGEYRKNVLLR